MKPVKPGYIYVLTHPSDPNLYKIGVTVIEPKKRLAQHNRDFSEAAGLVVEETGQKWELKEYHPVPDPYHAESVFWSTTPYPLLPNYDGIEIERMSWEEVQGGLKAAKDAGHRPPPKPLPDWIYAYTESMRKRLEGRGIELLGYVKSMVSGKSNFRCNNGHEWRTTPMRVAEGEGCPECGIGEMAAQQIRKMINAGTICLQTHPDKPGYIKIAIEYARSELAEKEIPCEGWQTHRFRNVEDIVLAETIIWKLLGRPLPHDREPIEKDLKIAEQAFRNLIDTIRKEVAIEEKREGNFQKTS